MAHLCKQTVQYLCIARQNFQILSLEIPRVSDQDSLIPDPDQDPAFQVEYQSGCRVLINKTGKNLQLKKKILIKNFSLLLAGPP